MRILIMLGSLASLVATAPPARAEDTANLQIQALWAKTATVPDLIDVDQIIIEGDAAKPALFGLLQKRGWLNNSRQPVEKRFFTRFERICHEPVKECFRVTGIWSGGQLISEPPFSPRRASLPIEASLPRPLSSFSEGSLPHPTAIATEHSSIAPAGR